MAEEIKYIPYGDNEIDYNQFVLNSANSVQNYVNLQPWSKKRKLSFLNAYQDLMTRGVTGASNTTGVWTVNHNGEQIDLNSLSKIDREMYGEAAYFIQQQMSGIPTKAKLTAEEKKELPLFDNNYFTTQFLNHISNNEFGGMKFNTQEHWNVLDERGENGLRGTLNRAKKLADLLESYSNSLEEGKYNFEGSPFKDLNDLKLRIGNTVSILRDGNPDNDKDALNKIGINYNDYFYNGENDPFKKDGYEGSYGDYYGRYLPELQENKRKAELQKLQQQLAQERANRYTNFRFFGSKLNGKPLGQGKDLNYLNGLAQKGNLTGDEQSEIVGAFRLALRNGALENLSREELSRFGFRYANTPSRLKKINGLNGLYWDSIGNRVVQPYNASNAPQTDFNTILLLNSPEYLAQQKKAQEELRRIDAGNRKVNDGEWLTEDYLRMAAMGLDIVGTVAAFLPGYGTAASAGLGLTSLGTNIAADIADDSVSKWDVAKNAGINLGLGIVGLVPGLGLAGKSGRWIAQAAKWAPRILTMAAAGLVALSDDIKASIAKLNSNETLTVNDWKNVGYALSTVAGVARGARGIVDNRKYKPAFKEPTKTETYITTKSGKKIPATKEQVEKINKAGIKGGTDKANEELRKLPGALNEEVNIEFKTGLRGKADLKNRVQLLENTTSTAASPRVQAYLRALQIQNLLRKSGLGIYKFAPRFLPTSYDIYRGATNLLLPQTNLTERIKKAWNPVGESKRTGKPTTSTPQQPNLPNQPNNPQPTGNTLRLDQFNRAIINRYKELSKGNFSKKAIIEGKLKIGDLEMGVSSMTNKRNGKVTYDIHFGSKHFYNLSQDKAKKKIFDLVKESRRQIDRNSGTVTKKSTAEVGKILLDLKRKGWLKQGGLINLLETISDFLNNNNL